MNSALHKRKKPKTTKRHYVRTSTTNRLNVTFDKRWRKTNRELGLFWSKWNCVSYLQRANTQKKLRVLEVETANGQRQKPATKNDFSSGHLSAGFILLFVWLPGMSRVTSRSISVVASRCRPHHLRTDPCAAALFLETASFKKLLDCIKITFLIYATSSTVHEKPINANEKTTINKRMIN